MKIATEPNKMIREVFTENTKPAEPMVFLAKKHCCQETFSNYSHISFTFS